jgi:pentatricopeptide repeat protein
MTQKAEISWEENSVVITYQDTKLTYCYSSLPDVDLVIPGVNLDEFNQMVERVRFDPKNFLANFSGRNDGPEGYQRCRGLALARTYPNSFNRMSQAFCMLAYRYIHDNMGTIKELESFYETLCGFKEIGDPYWGKHTYRWITSVWTALAHCYVKERQADKALMFFNKVHSFAKITLWPDASVNVLGACYVTGQSEDRSIEIYEAAVCEIKIAGPRKDSRLTQIINSSAILKAIMGNGDEKVPPLYKKAYSFLKIR